MDLAVLLGLGSLWHPVVLKVLAGHLHPEVLPVLGVPADPAVQLVLVDLDLLQGQPLPGVLPGLEDQLVPSDPAHQDCQAGHQALLLLLDPVTHNTLPVTNLSFYHHMP